MSPAPLRLARWLSAALCAAPLLAQAACPAADYILGDAEGDASVMHWTRGLVWKRCPEGQTFQGNQCTNTPQELPWHTWAEAQQRLPLSFTGQDGWGISAGFTQNLLVSGAWRLPYSSELHALNCSSKPDTTVFPTTQFFPLWTSSHHPASPGYVWVSTSSVSSQTNDYTALHPALLVRGGQPFAALTAPAAQSVPGGTQAEFAALPLAPSSGTGQSWGGARISGNGNPQFKVNSGSWVTEAIVHSGDQIAVRMTAPAIGANTATLTLRSSLMEDTTSDVAPPVRQTTASFALSASEAGVCGSAQGMASHTQPANLCTAGTASAVAGSSTTWGWTCAGTNTTATCQALRRYTVTPTAGAGGSISPATVQTVAYNATRAFTLTPAWGYMADGTAQGCGGSQTGSTFTTAPVTADCTISAAFKPTPLPVLSGVALSGAPSASSAVVQATSTGTGGGAATGYWLVVPRGSATPTPEQVKSPSGAGYPATPAAQGSTPMQDGTPQRITASTYLAGGTDYDFYLTVFVSDILFTPVQKVEFSTAVWPMTDTGQTQCHTGTALEPCTPANSGDSASYPAQDGRFGLDRAGRPKVGGGAAAFDFSCVLWDGTVNNAPGCHASLTANTSATASATLAADWACTLDNRTGLVWSLQTVNNITWTDANSTEAGNPTAAHNASARCGFADGWRVPTVRELLSIVHFGASDPAIDSDYFPGIPSDDSNGAVHSGYWSSQRVMPSQGNPWWVHFREGTSRGGYPASSTFNNVRLVRNAP